MKTILVPVDLSTVTDRVCAAARQLAATVKARLVLLHVVQPLPPVMSDFDSATQSQLLDWTEANEQAAARTLQKLGQRGGGRGPEVRTRLLTGHPVRLILEQAAALKADYIVIGSHGHGSMYDLIVGSTTNGVLRKAPCPVLVIPTGAKVK
ncbi:MAG: universal stress protein [Opitutaceae bacterium]|nr:universal stress protein [Opitutaceae bacterium]